MSDIAHPPVIYRVVREEGRILVHAWDEIMVAGVKVTIRDEQGKLLEVGNATRQADSPGGSCFIDPLPGLPHRGRRKAFSG